jgi:hypothetical protein
MMLNVTCISLRRTSVVPAEVTERVEVTYLKKTMTWMTCMSILLLMEDQVHSHSFILHRSSLPSFLLFRPWQSYWSPSLACKWGQYGDACGYYRSLRHSRKWRWASMNFFSFFPLFQRRHLLSSARRTCEWWGHSHACPSWHGCCGESCKST